MSLGEDFYVRLRIDESALKSDFSRVSAGMTSEVISPTTTSNISQGTDKLAAYNVTLDQLRVKAISGADAIKQVDAIKAGESFDMMNAKMLVADQRLKSMTGGFMGLASEVVSAMGKMMLWAAAGTAIFGTARAFQNLYKAGDEWIHGLETIHALTGGTIQQDTELMFVSKALGIETATLGRSIATLRSRMANPSGQKMIAGLLGVKSMSELKGDFNDTYSMMAKITEAAKKTGDAGKYVKDLFGMKGYEIGRILMLDPQELENFRKSLSDMGMSLDQDGYEKMTRLQHSAELLSAEMSLLGLRLYNQVAPWWIKLGQLFEMTLQTIIPKSPEELAKYWKTEELRHLISVYDTGQSGKDNIRNYSIMGMAPFRINYGNKNPVISKSQRDAMAKELKDINSGKPGGGINDDLEQTLISSEKVSFFLDKIKNQERDAIRASSKKNEEFDKTVKALNLYSSQYDEVSLKVVKQEKEITDIIGKESGAYQAVVDNYTRLMTLGKTRTPDQDKELERDKQIIEMKKGLNSLYDAQIDKLNKINDINNSIYNSVSKIIAGKGSTGDIFSLMSTFSMPGFQGSPDFMKFAKIANSSGGGMGSTMGAGIGGLFGPVGAGIGQAIGGFVDGLMGASDNTARLAEAATNAKMALDAYSLKLQKHDKSMDEPAEKRNEALSKMKEFVGKMYDPNKWFDYFLKEKKQIPTEQLIGENKINADAYNEWLKQYEENSGWYVDYQEKMGEIEHKSKMMGEEESQTYLLNMYKKMYKDYSGQMDKETKWMLEENIWRIEQNININADVKDVRDIEILSKQIVDRINIYQNSRYATMPGGR